MLAGCRVFFPLASAANDFHGQAKQRLCHAFFGRLIPGRDRHPTIGARITQNLARSKIVVPIRAANPARQLLCKSAARLSLWSSNVAGARRIERMSSAVAANAAGREAAMAR
jgi:hypothetical protein